MPLEARVVAVRTLDEGERPSYGRLRPLDRRSRVATVPIGYADGVPRALFTNGYGVLIGGRRRPLAGMVTMDRIVVDCGDDQSVRRVTRWCSSAAKATRRSRPTSGRTSSAPSATRSSAASGLGRPGVVHEPAAAVVPEQVPDPWRAARRHWRNCAGWRRSTHAARGWRADAGGLRRGGPHGGPALRREGPAGRRTWPASRSSVARASCSTDSCGRSSASTRDRCYIANVVKCRPPNNRDPAPVEIEACRPYLEEQITLIAPTVIVTLGNFATRLLLESAEGIRQLRGQAFPYRRGHLVPTYHPAYALDVRGRGPGRNAGGLRRAKRLRRPAGRGPGRSSARPARPRRHGNWRPAAPGAVPATSSLLVGEPRNAQTALAQGSPPASGVGTGHQPDLHAGAPVPLHPPRTGGHPAPRRRLPHRVAGRGGRPRADRAGRGGRGRPH